MIEPDDLHNRSLVAETHPPGWVSPTPLDRYDLVVIGGGSAGLISAIVAAELGASVALVERNLLGGDCLVHGCVPSKAVLHPAHVAAAARAGAPGVIRAEVSVDFAAVMENMRRIRAEIAPHDGAERLAGLGVHVFLGNAGFASGDTVAVDGVELRFRRCCIATGARPARPPIPGLEHAHVLTNEELFSLTVLPERLIVVGAGVIGCEMAQAFSRLGSKVSIVDMAARVLSREDEAASELVREQLVSDGVGLHLQRGVDRFERPATAVLDDGSKIEGEAILLAVGRRPNLDLGLDAAGVESTKQGVVVDDFLRTTNPRIYAAGDVIGQAQFTHAAGHHAALVVRNALFFGRARVSRLVIPRVTYTSPEVAAVGVSEAEAAQDSTLTTFTVDIAETDRGRTDGAHGFCSIHTDKKGRIRGATVVGEDAGELLAPITLAMTHGLTLGHFMSTIHPYPTRSEVVFKVVSLWNRTRLTPSVRRALGWVLRLRRVLGI